MSFEICKSIYSEWYNEWYYSNSRGVAIEFKVIIKELKTPDGNVLAFDVDLEGKRIPLSACMVQTTIIPISIKIFDGIVESFNNESIRKEITARHPLIK